MTHEIPFNDVIYGMAATRRFAHSFSLPRPKSFLGSLSETRRICWTYLASPSLEQRLLRNLETWRLLRVSMSRLSKTSGVAISPRRRHVDRSAFCVGVLDYRVPQIRAKFRVKWQRTSNTTSSSSSAGRDSSKEDMGETTRIGDRFLLRAMRSQFVYYH